MMSLDGTKMKKAYCLLLLGWMFAGNALAQNTGGVFPPTVNDGHRSWQYRVAFNPETDGFAQRFHYQQAIDGDFMWRVLGQTRKSEDTDFDFDFLQAELFWELSADGSAYSSGLRFDARVRDDSRPHQLGVNWIHQWALESDWTARAVVLTTYQFGDHAADGIGLGTRGQIAKRLKNGHAAGLQLFSGYGTTDDFRDFDDQSHTLGPMYSCPVGNGFSIFTGLLFGLTDASADTDVRVWLTRSL